MHIEVTRQNVDNAELASALASYIVQEGLTDQVIRHLEKSRNSGYALQDADGKVVYKYLKQNYPSKVLQWVKGQDWKACATIPLSEINMSRRPGGRDRQKVKSIAESVERGDQRDPIILVGTPQRGYDIADGYHRTLGFKHAGRKVISAYVCVSADEHGPWETEMHEAKLNKSFRDSGRYAISAIADLHKELGYGSENPPEMVAEAKGDYGKYWAQVWCTGMDWNAYWYLLDSEHDKPRLIAWSDEYDHKPLVVKKEGPTQYAGELKVPHHAWQDFCNEWVDKRAKHLTKSETSTPENLINSVIDRARHLVKAEHKGKLKHKQLIEKVSESIHNMWMGWSVHAAEGVSSDQRDRWKKMWIPYDQLPEAEKEKDRVEAIALVDAIDDHVILKSQSNRLMVGSSGKILLNKTQKRLTDATGSWVTLKGNYVFVPFSID